MIFNANKLCTLRSPHGEQSMDSVSSTDEPKTAPVYNPPPEHSPQISQQAAQYPVQGGLSLL